MVLRRHFAKRSSDRNGGPVAYGSFWRTMILRLLRLNITKFSLALIADHLNLILIMTCNLILNWESARKIVGWLVRDETGKKSTKEAVGIPAQFSMFHYRNLPDAC